MRLFRVALGARLTALDLAPEISLNAQQYVAAEGLGPSAAADPFLDGDGLVGRGHDLQLGAASVGAAATFPAIAARSRSLGLGLGVDAANTSFTLTAPAILSAVSPASGPLSGQTQLRLSGSNLRGGCDYRCRFSAV